MSSADRKVSLNNNNEKQEVAADFEAAVAATGFGKFNILLVCSAFPSILTTSFEMTSLSFVFPAAQCDLNLNIEDKGFINGTIYAGMILGCFIWGPLIDLFGRKRILIIGHYLVIFFIVMVMFSTNFFILLFAKFMGGFIITAPSAALSPYLSEFHGKRYRSKIQLCMGLLYSISNVILPLIAWSILPLDISVNIFDFIEFHSWNVFLLVCTLPAFLSGLFFTFMPESPKYLMTQGRNAAALDIFQRIYSLNSGNPKTEYQISKLIQEKNLHFSGNPFKQAWKQITPLFSAKHAYKLFLTCILQMLIMICLNSLRLWFPQLFQSMSDYKTTHNEEGEFCAILALIKNSSHQNEHQCSPELDSSIFFNSVIVASSTTVAYIVATSVINKFSKKKFMFFLIVASSTCYYCLYFSSGILTLVLICGYYMTACVFIDVVIAATIDLFPTSLRGSAFSLGQMSGRVGSLIGNLAFPFLVEAGCAPPILVFGTMLALCGIFSILLPNTDMKSLE